MVKKIPDGYNTISPHLIVDNASDAIKFYKAAFNAEEYGCLNMPDGKVGHAELKIGNSMVMLADEFAEMGMKSPKSFGGSPVSIHVYVEDVDAAFKIAVAAGAVIVMPPTDQFFGDRMCRLKDPFGYDWAIATHIEDLSLDEIKARLQQQDTSK